MKNLLKIGALSLALIASVFILNANAQDAGPVTLELTNGTDTCVYGTSIDLGQHVVSYDAFNMTGGNFTPSTRYCADNQGHAPRTMTVELTDDLTNQYAQSIPEANVYMDSSVNYVMSGTCTTGLNTINTWTAIDSVQTVLEKASATGQVCTIAADTVNLAVAVPASQPVGMYTGTLTVTLPF